MTPFLRKLLGMNWVVVGLMLALTIFGILAVYAASYFKTDDYWHKQTLFAGIGFGIFLVLSFVDYRWIRWGALPMYIGSIVLLILTYTSFGVEHGGAKCWLRLPGIPEVQPSQLCVISTIMVLSLFLTQFRQLHPMLRLGFVGIIAGGPMALILKQPDFGMTMAYIPVLLTLLFVGGLPKRYLIAILVFGVACLPLAYYIGMKPYQQKRIIAFMDPEIDPKGAAWAINRSLIAIGSGGWAGKGFKAPNTQAELGFLPGTTVHTDYIFAATAEQIGFLGNVVLLAAFGLLLLSILFTAQQAADDTGLLICSGIAALIFFHVYQNVGMTISLMPITGLPLPLISYGGSFVVLMMFSLGLVNSVWVHRKAAV